MVGLGEGIAPSAATDMVARVIAKVCAPLEQACNPFMVLGFIAARHGGLPRFPGFKALGWRFCVTTQVLSTIPILKAALRRSIRPVPADGGNAHTANA